MMKDGKCGVHCLAMTLVFFVACLAAVVWIFRTGYRLKT